jgi:hypothetical protein
MLNGNEENKYRQRPEYTEYMALLYVIL